MFTTRTRRRLIAIGAALLLSSIALDPSAALAAKGDCSQPVTNGASPTASDCLVILKASVGSATCDPTCICDPNSSGGTSASDALVCMKKAVGQNVTLNCPCAVTTTTVPVVTTTVPGTTTTVPGTTTTVPGTTTTVPGTTTTVPGTTTTVPVTTTTLGGSTECPSSALLTVYAGTGSTCATNSDCPVGTCDLGLLRCLTATELDTGWTGISHDADVTNAVVVKANLDCGGTGPACGQCSIAGVDPEPRNCRCVNNNRTICNSPLSADPGECPPACVSGETGGVSNIGNPCTTNADCGIDPGTAEPGFCDTSDVCNCYVGPPLALSAGNTPACVANKLAQDLTGTVDVDTGASESPLHLRSVVYLGETIHQPCPYCDGDTTPGDGVREGTCVLGPNDGSSCDADAKNESFPAPGGGWHSLDCFPSEGKNVSGQGLKIDITQSTGSQSIAANILCGFPPFTNLACHCGICSTNTSVACSSDQECSDVGAGVCQRKGANDPLPNQCVATCVDKGDGVTAQCDENGPDDRYCDAIVRANGEGFIQCQSNADCSVDNIGIPAGNCSTGGICTDNLCPDSGACTTNTDCERPTLSKRRPCFLPTIAATGIANPETPLSVGVFCIPSTTSAGINTVAGLPGPGRLFSQGLVQHFCTGGQYQAGVGCP